MTTLGAVCRDLEAKGVPTQDAAAYILADMANQAIMRGLDPKEAVDMCHKVIMAKDMKENTQKEVRTRPYSMVATQKDADEIRQIITLMNNYLMCCELIFCDMEQKYAYHILGILK